MGILDTNYPQTDASGLLSPAAATGIAPGQQKWLDALGAVSAGLKDAGAWLQHNPAAAGNVAAFARQRAGLQPANAVPSVLAHLSPNILAALLLHAAQQNATGASVTAPNQMGGQAVATGPTQMPLQTAPAPMLQQPPAPQLPNSIPTAQPMPAQNSGWGVQKVR